MIPADELYLDNFWNIKKALGKYHAIDIYLAVFEKIFKSKFPPLFIFALQLLQF